MPLVKGVRTNEGAK